MKEEAIQKLIDEARRDISNSRTLKEKLELFKLFNNNLELILRNVKHLIVTEELPDYFICAICYIVDEEIFHKLAVFNK